MGSKAAEDIQGSFRNMFKSKLMKIEDEESPELKPGEYA